ncbi:MAG: hypothetical protein AB1452_06755 [Pseudomonadota bacterium]
MDYTESRQGKEAAKRSCSNRPPVATLRSALRPIARFAVALWLVFCQYGCASLIGAAVGATFDAVEGVRDERNLR